MASTGASFFRARQTAECILATAPTPRASIRRKTGTPMAVRSGSRTPSPSRSEEHTSELQSLMRISYAVFCLKKKTATTHNTTNKHIQHLMNQHLQRVAHPS